MGHPVMSPDDALKLHRVFLQEVLAEVMPLLSMGAASGERLILGLHAYWDACFARREMRCEVLAATGGSEFEPSVEPMGRPFQMMVRAELTPEHGAQAEALAQLVYAAARAVSVDEALGGQRLMGRRHAVAAMIRAEYSAAA